MPDFIQVREALGSALRQQRREAGLTGRQLAAACGWLPSKVSRIENGLLTPSPDDISTWATATANPQAAPALRELLSTLESFYRDWRRQSAAGSRFIQRRWLDLEAQAQRLRVFEPHFVPGLLQTAEYARGRLAAHAVLHNDRDDVEEAVAVRMERQRILQEATKRFHFVVTETGLRSGAYATAPVMAAQVERLVAATHGTTLTLGIVPMRTAWEFNVDHGFWIFDDDYVLVETVTAELRLTQPEELATYRRVFQMFADRAVYGAAARDLLGVVAADAG
jgi:transcriptional regulator with XRE-family HTH domain